MPIRVEIQGTGQVAEFPDGTPPEEMKAALARYSAKQAQPQQQASESPLVQQQPQAKPDKGILGGARDVGLELMAAVNRGAVNLADFLTVDQVNALSQLAGSDFRLPSLGAAVESGTVGGFMDPGLARDVTRAAGEVVPASLAAGSVLRGAAAQLPKFGASSEGTFAGAVRQMGQSTGAADVGFGAASGAGAELGEQVGGTPGQIAGAILAPVSIAAAQSSIKGLVGAGKRGIEAFSKTVEGMSDDGASTLLAEMMVREGLGPDDVAKQLQALGPEGTLADVGTSFARLLRLAGNKVQRIEGRAASELGARQARQGDRIIGAFDDAAGVPKLTLDDELIRLEKAQGPRIRELYDQAAQGDFAPSPQLQKMLSESPSIMEAAKKAEKSVADVRATGKSVTEIERLDEIKKSLGDMIGEAIRGGRNAEVSRLTELKNRMVREMDAAVPEYKQARDAFAGKAALQNASEIGEQFLKLKPSEVARITESMGASEKRFFKLGAKQAIINKLDNMQLSRDSVKALFGRGGDARRLRSVFDTEKQFDSFMDIMDREARFVITRRAAQENSTTAKQLFDEKSMIQAMDDARRVMTDPVEAAGILGRMASGLSAKKGSAANVKALEKAGDILLEAGVDPARIERILRRGNARQVESAVRQAISASQPRSVNVAAPAAGVTQRDNRQERQQQAMPPL